MTSIILFSVKIPTTIPTSSGIVLSFNSLPCAIVVSFIIHRSSQCLLSKTYVSVDIFLALHVLSQNGRRYFRLCLKYWLTLYHKKSQHAVLLSCLILVISIGRVLFHLLHRVDHASNQLFKLWFSPNWIGELVFLPDYMILSNKRVIIIDDDNKCHVIIK